MSSLAIQLRPKRFILSRTRQSMVNLSQRFSTPWRALGAPSIALVLGGCASFSPDAGVGLAQTVAFAELGKDVTKVTSESEAFTAQARAEQLLRRPLTPESAVQIALLKNRGLQAALNDLGVSEAAFVQATLPPVPRVSLSNAGGDLSVEITRQVVVSLLQLATLPVRITVAERRFQSAQYRAAEAVVRLAAEAQRQYYRTVAANQTVSFLEQALATADSASTLARALGETGAMNKLEQAREHAFYVELGAQLARARVQQKVEREKLVRQLGLWGRDIDFKLPGSLPPLPARLLAGTKLGLPPEKWSSLRYGFEPCGGLFDVEEAQAGRDRHEAAAG